MAGALTALPGCTPYVHGYAYTTHQTFSTGAAPATPQPSPTPVSPPEPSTSSSPATRSAVSDRLTYYLQGHRLPLVGAQVMDAADGNRKVILYGYVATPHGKHDAEDRARRFLNDPGAEIDNRIVIQPELLTPSPALSAAASSFPPLAAAPSPGTAAPAPSQQLQPAQLNELLGALLVGMAIVSTLPTAAGAGALAPPGSIPPAPPPAP
ncbi:MAG TPA: hypothetical protein VMV15_00035 [Candidatus Binataceae bacterium]|nr:hypothetical protein [Candidatus Binataceae bacterium]